MRTVKIKTSELTGHALDWAVAVCEGCGENTYMRNINICKDVRGRASMLQVPIQRTYVRWSPSTDHAQGGLIMDREFMDTVWQAGGRGDLWTAYANDTDEANNSICADGPTRLIAAMRCYVVSKLGDEVEVPEELA